MLTQKQIDEFVKEKFKDMESSLNEIEKQVMENGDEFNKVAVSFHSGKIYNDYKVITNMLEIYKE